MLQIDVWGFCRKGLSLRSSTAETRSIVFKRLTETLGRKPVEMVWSIAGHSLENAECTLVLSGSFQAEMKCHRCDQYILQRVEFKRYLKLCKSEQEADSAQAADENQNDDEIDFVAATSPVDMMGWLEDEMLLSLPMFVRHEMCEPSVKINPSVNKKLSSTEKASADNPQGLEPTRPFAVLAHLKKPRTSR